MYSITTIGRPLPRFLRIGAAALLLPLDVVGAQRDATARGRDLDSSIVAIVSRAAGRGFSGVVLVNRETPHLRIVAAAGAEGGRRVREDSRFWISSMAKQFVSAAVLACVEAGTVQLDAPITTYLGNVPADKQRVTVEQLLSHTSGLRQSHVFEHVPTRARAVRRMLAEPLIDEPGAAFHYSNSNYQLAIAIVEHVTHQTYRSFVRDRLWRRAGLLETGFAVESGAREVVPVRFPVAGRSRPGTWSGGGTYSTVTDLARWMNALQSGQVLSAGSVERLFAPIVRIEEGWASLGWFRSSETGARHFVFTRGNDSDGPNSLIYQYPGAGVTIVILTHAGDDGDGPSWSRVVLRELEEHLRIGAAQAP